MKIKRPQKIASYSIAAGIFLGLSVLILGGKDVVVGQLNSWQVLPRPERLTELYFTNYKDLPQNLKARTPQVVRFTVHNLEHQTTTYNYEIVATTDTTTASQKLATGSFTIENDKTKSTASTITIPPLGEHMAIRVNVTYQAIALGAETPSQQTQSAYYWLHVNTKDT